MSKRVPSPVLVVLLTWVNMAILLVNLFVSSTHETAVARTARNVAEIPSVLPTAYSARPAVDMPPGSGSESRLDAAVAGDAEHIERVIEAVFVESRVRSRVSALLQAMARLQERGELSPLDDDRKSRIVALGRSVAENRAKLERKLMAQEAPSLSAWNHEIETFEERAREEARSVLEGLMSPAEAQHLLRFIAPLRQSLAATR